MRKSKSRYGVLKCIRNYRFHSIFVKNLLLIFCMLLLPFICILSISTYTYDELQKSEKKAYTDELTMRITNDIENLFHEIQYKAILMNANSDVQLFYYAKTIDDDEFYDVYSIIESLSLYNISTEVIDAVYVYAPRSQVVISSSGRFAYDNFYDKECLDRWENSGEMYKVEYLCRQVAGAEKESLSFYYAPLYVAGQKGVAVFNINMDKLRKELDYGDDVNLWIVGNHQLLYDSTDSLTGIPVENAEELVQILGNEITICNELEQSGMELVVHVNASPLYEKLDGVRAFIRVFIGIIFLLTILVVFYISQKIFDPISEMLEVLSEETEMDEGVILQNKNEISYIRDSIYATISKRKDIEEELVFRIKLLKKAQAVALQSQINPHFINNTLETINWMVIRQLGAKNDVSEMLDCLSELLRVSLKDSDTFVTLREEMEYVKKYLYIQQKRLNDQFDMVLNIPEELEKCKVIKMILQPVVENAINYGIKPYKSRGRLEIKAEQISGGIRITVWDSGLGLTQTDTDEINQSIRKEVIKENSHIGLSNINQRIALAYGYEYGVTVQSKIGAGTSVALELPWEV